METTIYVIIVLMYSLLFLILTIGILYLFCPLIVDLLGDVTSFGSIVVALLMSGFCVFFVFGSVSTIYTVANSFFGNPKPSNQIELYENGEIMIQYQDTTHFCNAKDENSMCFTSRIPANGKVSKNDICVYCGNTFINHDTHKEQRFFEAMSTIRWEDYGF